MSGKCAKIYDSVIREEVRQCKGAIQQKSNMGNATERRESKVPTKWGQSEGIWTVCGKSI